MYLQPTDIAKELLALWKQSILDIGAFQDRVEMWITHCLLRHEHIVVRGSNDMLAGDKAYFMNISLDTSSIVLFIIATFSTEPFVFASYCYGAFVPSNVSVTKAEPTNACVA